MKKILILAGEASGDLYGAHLVRAIRRNCSGVTFLGIGGSCMKEAGVEILYPIDELSIIGVSEILLKLKILKEAFSILCEKISREKIDIGILVNYPGFNLRFSRILKAKNIPVVFYSSPQVWAWGKWRIRDIKRSVDKMIVFFKFEKDFYEKNGIESEFVGHPLVDLVRPKEDSSPGLENDIMPAGKSVRMISLAPGSRKSEVKNIFRTMLKAAHIIHSRCNNTKFFVTKHPSIPVEIYNSALKGCDLPVEIIDGGIYDCLRVSDVAIVVSGSVTLEAAILRTPMIIVNKISFLNALLYLFFVRLANVGLVNIIAGKRIMPELLQYNATARNIAKETVSILSDNEKYRKMRDDLEIVNKLIGPPGASSRAADIIQSML